MSESTMRYDPENDIFFHKHEDGSWSAYFCERHESLEEDEVRPYRGSFEPVGVAHPMTSHIQPLAAEARPVRSRGHRVKHDSRMLDRPPRPVGAVNVFILDTRRASSGSPTTPGGRLMRAHLMLDSGSVAYRTVTGAEWSRS